MNPWHRIPMRWTSVMLVAHLGILATIGCSKGEMPLTGFVQFEDGEPVQSGSIEFRSLTSGKQFASRIEPDGAFRLLSRDGKSGCPEDEYEAVVVQIVMTQHLSAEHHQHGRTVPRRYADYSTSDLRALKQAGQDSPLTIILRSQ